MYRKTESRTTDFFFEIQERIGKIQQILPNIPTNILYTLYGLFLLNFENDMADKLKLI